MASGSPIHIPNPHVQGMTEDVLYHLALGTNSHDLPSMFGDLKFVCVGGSPRRMEKVALYMADALDIDIPTGMALNNIGHGKARYAIYKVGPVLAISHGMGRPSMSIMMHELFKLLHHAGCTGVTLFRVGTCGGLGLEPGSVVVTEEALSPLLQPSYDQIILGNVVSRPCVLDKDTANDLMGCASTEDEFATVKGKTMSADDFYEEQGRLDGALCNYTEDDKMAYLKRAHDLGVRNIEMEAVCFAALSHAVQLKGAVACVTLVDRLKGDQITSSAKDMEEWQMRPQKLVARYIRKNLGLPPKDMP
ncbi:unnamed protein product [Owenia fusiformis]|uniref:Uridine phosphorylase n=1 Tax=Owenia fusiformis TaxID=6347 RepID=A0A8S4N1N0_OWEFU|nr:unnamed protein product [Owenia fusiformis]